MAYNLSQGQPNLPAVQPFMLTSQNTNAQKLSLHKDYQTFDSSFQSKYETIKN
jgi:hypothetical protein